MKKIGCVLMLFFCIGIQGCEKTNYQEYEMNSCVTQSVSMENEDTIETKITETEELGMVLGAEALETEEFESEEAISYDYVSVYERAINYAVPVLCEEGYEILCENICVNPKSVYEDSWLVEQLEDILDTCKDCEWAATDYFLFDLNDDGIEEYIVSIYSSGWIGSSGHLVEILRKNEDGSPDTIFYVTAELYFDKNEYLPLTVLNDKSDGYYKIVFPFSEMIWEYNGEEDEYFTCYPYRPYE